MHPITTGQRLFTCGHSFHEWIAPILAELAQSSGIENHTIVGHSSLGGSTPGGTPVSLHFDRPEEENDVVPALRAGAIDVLTLSPIWLPDEGIERFARLALDHNSSVRITAQEFWLPNDEYLPVYPLETKKVVDHNATDLAELRRYHERYFRDMEAMAREINGKLEQKVIYLVPTAQAVLALREKIADGQAPGLNQQSDLFADSWGHVHQHIKALNAYCHFVVIYRKNPMELPAPAVLKEAGLTPEDEAALNRLLQELAWDAVAGYPYSGVRAH